MSLATRTLVPDDFRPGIYPGEPDEVYFRRRIGVATNSILKIIDTQTLGHYLHYIKTGQDEDAAPVKDTEAQLIGRAFHCYVLEPERFASTYGKLPDFGSMQSAKNRARRDEWLGYQPKDRVFLHPRQFDLVAGMRESLMRHRTARLMVERGQREVVFRWIDPETGLACQSKIDLFDEGLAFALDLKSCLSASEDLFGRTIANYRYHVQHAMYAEASKAVGLPIKNFLLVPVEKEPPYFSAIYQIDEAAEEKGFELLARSLRKLADAMARYVRGDDLDDAFPAYGHSIRTIHLPGWAFGL